MKRICLILLFGISLPFVRGGLGWGSTLPPHIISLKPNITEILFALGAGDKVIGVTTWCDYPPEAKKIAKVADYININTEKIIALKPDLVIGSEENSVKEPFKILENAGIRTLFLSFKTFDDMYESIEKIAEVVGKVEEGEKIEKHIRHVIASLPKQSPEHNYTQGIATPASRARNDTNLSTHTPFDFAQGRLTHLHTPSILMLVGHRPLIAAGPGTFLGEMIELAGAKNIVTSKTPYPTINTEFIIAKNPDVIIDLGMGSDISGELPEILRDKVIKMDMSDFRAGPRIGKAIKNIHETFNIKKIANN